MNNNDIDDLWNSDIFPTDSTAQPNDYNNGIFYEWNNQPNESNQYYYAYNDCTADTLYYEYNHVYSQLKPIMNLAQDILSPELLEHYQSRLDVYDNNINHLENILATSGQLSDPTSSYLIMDNNNNSDNMNYVPQYYDMNDNYYQTINEQWNIENNNSNDDNINYDLTCTLPVEYIDYNNNDNNGILQAACYNTDTNINANYELVTLNTEPYEFHSEESFKSIDDPINDDTDCALKLDCDSETIQSDNQDSLRDFKKKKRRKIYTKKATENGDKRVWYRCGWEGCSFGSYYNGVVKRHSFKRHCGEVRIAQSESDSMHRFKCDWPGCDVSLVAYHKLVEHKRRHTGEKPFGCKWKACQYSTGRLYSLIIHERVHKAEHHLQ